RTGALSNSSTWTQGDSRSSYFTAENLKSSDGRGRAHRPLIPEGATCDEMTLRCVLSVETDSTDIARQRSVRHVDDNTGDSDAGPLSDELLKKLATHRWVRQPTDWSQ